MTAKKKRIWIQPLKVMTWVS